MTQRHHPQGQAADFQKLDFTLWRLQREHDLRHQQDVNRSLNERPRERSEDLH